jgi:hypothetical protein
MKINCVLVAVECCSRTGSNMNSWVVVDVVGCFKTLCFDPTWDEDKYVEIGGLTPDLCHACDTSQLFPTTVSYLCNTRYIQM